MRKRTLIILAVAFFVLSASFLFANTSSAQSVCGGYDECLAKQREYEAKLSELSKEKNTLSNQIAQFNAQISLTETKIETTQEKIKLLGGRIDQLEISLSDLTKAFSSRVVETYKMSRTSNAISVFSASKSLSSAVNRIFYLKKIQEADHDLLMKLQDAQDTYKEQKAGAEDLHKELEGQKKVLSAQKMAKDQLLQVTKNDERRYQDLLAKARAEIEAIQSIIAGKGEETEAGGISEGQRIASIISSASTCSSGGHLHFEVVQNGGHQNPVNFLSSRNVIWDNGPDGPFNFSGSWSWPVNDPIRITQGYGMTYYAANLKYYGGSPHTGIDMVNQNDYTVKAVKPGTLFRGAMSCGGGTLRYVRVKQHDGYDTYYLHVNY